LPQESLTRVLEPGKGRQKDEITAALAHAVRFEEHPRVRRAAAYAIYILDVFQNETLAEVIRERIVVEPEEDVQEVLRLILGTNFKNFIKN
jgi:hypothetical protein